MCVEDKDFQLQDRTAMTNLQSKDHAEASSPNGLIVKALVFSSHMEDAEVLAIGLTLKLNASQLVGKTHNLVLYLRTMIFRGGSRFNQGSFPSFGSSFGQSSCNQSPFLYGNCGGNFRFWSYVWQTNSCQPFTYSGCGGGSLANR